MTTRSPFGTEFSTFRGGVAGLDPTFTEISGEILVVECVLRRWITPKGSIPDLPNDGEDVRSYLQMRNSATNRARCKRNLEAEARKEDGVAQCEVTVEPKGDGLRVVGSIKTKSGKAFRAVIDANLNDLKTSVSALSEI